MKLEVVIFKKLSEYDLDVCFESHEDRLGLMGPSGSGKSMVLKCIAGIMTPDAGRIVLDDEVLFDSDLKINISPQKRKIGYMFQNYALFDHMNVYQNIAAPLKAHHEDKQVIKEKVQQIMKDFQIDDLQKRYPRQLSGGQKQRVALARLLVYDTNLVLLDEPFSALDESLKEMLLNETKKKLIEYQKKCLFVTHSPKEMEMMCDNKLKIKRGMIVTLCGCSSTQDQQEEVTLTFAAAASLENTFEDKLIPEFEKENPNIKVQGVYDSSGKLQIQIEQGLKADVFFSAATKQMDALVDEKYINKKDVVDLLENKLVLITGKQTTTEVKDFANIAKAETIAIGDHEVVPAGQYAKMALTHLGLYDALSSKYSLGGNVTEVLNWVASSSSEVGIVYSTDAKSSKDVKVLATCENSLLDEPVIYPVAKLAKTKHSDETEKFIKFIQKKSSLKQFENYGFTVNK